MSITANIIDGQGSGKTAKVGPEGEIYVVLHTHPPLEETVISKPFRQYFSDDGEITGSNDMAVNGLAPTIDFYINAVEEFDIYVKYISVEIGDGGSPNLNSFGAISALANGVGWIWFNQDDGEYELHEGIKTNKEFVARVGNDTAAVGDGVNAFLADVSGGASEKSYFPSIDFTESFGLPFGVRLKKGSTDKLIFRVRDDLTALTTFNIVGTGIRL